LAGEEQLHRRVGAAGIAVLVLGVAAAVALSGRHLGGGRRFHVELDRTGALTVGAPLVLAGRTVGRIDDIRLVHRDDAPASYAQDPTAERARVVLDVWIEERWAYALHQSSELFQNQPSVLAEAYLEIGPPRGGAPTGPPLPAGGTIRGANPPRMDQIAQRSYENLRNVVEMLRTGFPEAKALGVELDALSTELDKLSADTPGGFANFAAARARLWDQAIGAWQDWQASGTNGDEIARAAAHAQATIARTRAQLDGLRVKLTRLEAGIDTVRARLAPADAARFEAALARIDDVSTRAGALLAHAQTIADMVARGEGTIGAFLADTELADDFKAMTKILKERPWETIGHPQK
jgi:hypothetical protein